MLEAVLGTFSVFTIRWSLFLSLFCREENKSLERRNPEVTWEDGGGGVPSPKEEEKSA